MALTIEKANWAGVPVLKVEGLISDTDVYCFSRELKAMAKLGHPRIALDVTGLEFINSHGLGVLVVHANSMQKENRDLVIINENPKPDGYMAGLFRSTGLVNFLKIITDRRSLQPPQTEAGRRLDNSSGLL